ncbi:hypothetical protein LOD99_2416 [Oopsacas minuta]|uniref:Uncharacterized protein n=1 Tax=Oopsacas minuta TaxID=111878 RepID=A0AAV7K1M4_9METZ|nr:hypothetical protein LOD99_2416 [Oopsacas minuta]
MTSFNIIILGDGGVGKSSITLRFYEDRFEDEYHPTVEDAFTMEKVIDREVVRLEVIDTAGQEGFHHLREMYMSTEGAGYMLAYAINLRDSFLSLTELHKSLSEARNLGVGQFVPVVLIGNKSDRAEQRCVSTAEAMQLARGFGNDCPFFETSAKTGANIEEAFTALVRQMKKSSPIHQKSFSKSKTSKKKAGKSGCSLI